MIKYEFTYDSEPAFVVSVNREVLWRTYGGWTISFLLVGVVAIVGLLTGSYRGFWSFALGMVSLYFFYLWQVWKRLQSIGKTIKPIPINLVLDESGCSFDSNVSRRWISWSSIKRLHHHKTAISLELEDGSYSVPIPSRVLTEDASRFLDQSFKQAKLTNGIRFLTSK